VYFKNSQSSIGTEIFRDHGFVEAYPRHWIYQPRAIQVDDGENVVIYSNEQIKLEVLGPNEIAWTMNIIWDNTARNFIRRTFRMELRRLYRIQNTVYDFSAEKPPYEDLPLSEWNSIKRYYSAVTEGLELGIAELENGNDEEKDEERVCSDDSSGNNGGCPNEALDKFKIHYDDLKEEEDPLDYIIPTCSTSQIVQFEYYDDKERLKTNYQKLAFVERDEDYDICMNLETTLQICSSYRPHYHEYFVHFPARFLKKVERVIFIGGGDAMLLHEILKHETVEKVVGLELDQQVTRKSFKWFHSQPHWDDDRVEWWYGDASKSLPLLPKDYWGSFDLVLVDLSETVMSMSVTKELDIFETLSLLLKHEGIMVKNEPYIDNFENFFDHSIHIFYGSPKICTQVLSMGSNGIDFLRDDVKEADVEKFLLEDLDQPLDRYKYYHDYRKTSAAEQQRCNRTDASETQYGRKAGILELVEMEGSKIALDGDAVEVKFVKALSSLGLKPLSKRGSSKDVALVVMEEGYVIGRLWPEHRYVSLDINMWGAFDKVEEIKQILNEILGTSRLSSYRVVVGGMHGSSTWEQDKAHVGIHVKQTRDCSSRNKLEESQKGMGERDAIALAMATSIDVPTWDDQVLAIAACGKAEEECIAERILSESQKVNQVLRIDECEKTENAPDKFACERDTMAKLKMGIAEKGKMVGASILVMDMTASTEMLQVWHSILAVPAERELFLNDAHMALTITATPNGGKKDIVSERRHIFMERHRWEANPLPLSMAFIELTAAEDRSQDLSIDLYASGERYFFDRVTKLENNLQMKLTGAYTVEITSIKGGLAYFDDDYNERIFPRDAYDPYPALDQAADQMQLGRQSIFQLEPVGAMPSMDVLEKAFHDTIMEAVGASVDEPPAGLGRIVWSERYNDIGDGAAAVAVFSTGNAILTWDGESHVDVNLFFRSNNGMLADDFLYRFSEKTGLERTLRDDQPRGTGRIVQFEEDVLDRKVFPWLKEQKDRRDEL